MPRTASYAGVLLVGVLLAVAFALPVQSAGCTQTSHLALTKALARGTSRIDRWQRTTCDKAYVGGHYYSVKAPGLATTALPTYLIVHGLGLRPSSSTTLIWLLNLFTVIPSALALLYLVRRVAEWAAPGTGFVAAAALGLGTLVLPFSTLWFGHLPGAALAFAAFALLLREGVPLRDRRIALGSGFLAGAAVLFEYPLGLVALALLIYVGATRGLRNAGLFIGGAAIPAALLVAYNSWAFGSPTHISYRDTVAISGNTGHDVIASFSNGFFGITWPSGHALAELLLSQRGLLTLTPVCLLGGLGIILLRERARAEAIFTGALVACFVVYNSGLTDAFGGPFGGDTPGPRYLIAVLPFLMYPIGLAVRASPGATAALLGASVVSMLVATATQPMVGEGETHVWWDAVRDGRFTHTLVTLAGGGSGWGAVLPFAVLVAAVAAVAVWMIARQASSPVQLLFDAACAIVAWLLVVTASSRLFEPGRREAGALALGLAVLVAAVAALWARGRRSEAALDTNIRSY